MVGRDVWPEQPAGRPLRATGPTLGPAGVEAPRPRALLAATPPYDIIAPAAIFSSPSPIPDASRPWRPFCAQEELARAWAPGPPCRVG